jgi:hypothetical protein
MDPPSVGISHPLSHCHPLGPISTWDWVEMERLLSLLQGQSWITCSFHAFLSPGFSTEWQAVHSNRSTRRSHVSKSTWKVRGHEELSWMLNEPGLEVSHVKSTPSLLARAHPLQWRLGRVASCPGGWGHSSCSTRASYTPRGHFPYYQVFLKLLNC